MAVLIVDENGQTFISPPELDQFTYFRDYILRRTFKEFFELNPGSAEEGWVDVSGQEYWDLVVVDDDEQDAVVWDGKHVLVLKDNEDFDLIAKARGWPDSPPQLPWTRYLRPTRIRFTIKNNQGNRITRTGDLLWFDGDSEFMQAYDVGAANFPNGFIFPVDPQLPIIGDEDHIRFFRFSYWNGYFKENDKITKIEFGYDPIDLVDYTTTILDIDEPFATKYINYVTTGANNAGTPVIQLSDSWGYDDYHGIWNGESWDYYYLPVISGQSGRDIIGYDDFGNVHYIQAGTPGAFKRWSWNLSSGFYEQDIDYSLRPTDQFYNVEMGRQQAVDPDGYSHFVCRGRTAWDEYRNFVSHYYQDASGWHHEEIFDIGDNNPDDYDWYGTIASCQHVDMAIDSYGKVHVFVEIVMREPAPGSQAIAYVTNSKTGGWTYQILEPWGEVDGRLECLDIYVDRENDNYLTGIIGSRDMSLLFMEKEFTAANWTYTAILSGTDHDYLQSVKIGDIYHLLGNHEQRGYYYVKMMDYLKYDGQNHEIISNKYMYTTGAAVSGSQILWPNITYYARDGKPILCTSHNSLVPGIVEQEINE